MLVVVCLAALAVTAMGQACDPKVCVLPNCRCATDTAYPGGLKYAEVPQIVMVTFENSINADNFNAYSSLFNVVNPNGCPVRGTFFAQDEGSDFDILKTLYDEGHEIGIHSIDGTSPTSFEEWVDLYKNVKNKLVQKKIAEKDIVGARVPELAPGGTDQLIGMGDNSMLYDSSCARTGWSDKGSLVWPFTLDYLYPGETCDNGQVPTLPFPGYWEVPIHDLHDLTSEGSPCVVPSACRNITTKDDSFKLFFTAFEDHITSNKAPMLMIIDPQWAKTGALLQGTVEFLDYIRAAFPNDVWIVPVRKALSWIQDPVPLANISTFDPWTC